MKLRYLGIVFSVAFLFVLSASANAATIQPYTANSSFAVDSADQPGTGAAVTSSALWAGSATNLNNGGGGGYENGITVAAGLQPGDYVTYTFDLTNAGNGWDITGITSYASWDTASGGRSRQGYSVTATLKNGKTVNVLPAQTYVDGTDSAATKVEISGLQLSGVTSLTFSDFVSAPAPGAGNIYHEIDVFGTASQVPEPSTLLMIVTGISAILAYAWRKRK